MLKKLSVLALSAVILTGCSWSHVKTVNSVDAGNITKVCVVANNNKPADPAVQQMIQNSLLTLGVDNILVSGESRSYENQCSNMLKFSTRGGNAKKIGLLHVRFYKVNDIDNFKVLGEISHKEKVKVANLQPIVNDLIKQLLNK